MILIGIAGAIGHGKTTVAEALLLQEPSSMHLETGMIVAEVADQLNKKLHDIPKIDDISSINRWLANLPSVVQAITGKSCSASQILLTRQGIAADRSLYKKLFEYLDDVRNNPELVRHDISIANKSNYRSLLQWLGGYLVKKVDAGIWYDELVKRLLKSKKQLRIVSGVRFPNDAQIIHSAGGIVLNVVRPKLTERDIEDPTERERSGVKSDIVIINNGTIPQLSACVSKILSDIRHKRTQVSYNTDEY